MDRLDPTIRALVFAAAIVAAACFDNPTGPDAVLGKPFELKTGDVSALPDGSRLRFERLVSDSRCPMDAVCVWAGDATIAVTLTSSKGSAESRELHTQPTGSQISYASYTIALTQLAPYPRSSQKTEPDDYIATFVVSVR
jgi:hypothetical protein